MRYFKIILPELSDPLPLGWDDEKTKLFEENKKLIGFFLSKFIKANSRIPVEDLEEVNSEMNEDYFDLINKYDPCRKCKFGTYMGNYIKAVSRDKLRQIFGRENAKVKRPETISLDEVSFLGNQFWVSVNSENPEDTFIKRNILERCLQALDEKQRGIINLYFFLGISQREIAERIGVSQIQVSRLITLSIEIMRNALGSEELSDGFAG